MSDALPSLKGRVSYIKDLLGKDRDQAGRLMLALLGAILILSVMAGAAFGSMAFDAVTVVKLFLSLFGIPFESLTAAEKAVFAHIRLPRVLFAALAGSGLAVAGAVLQGLFRNPLADPGLIGVSSGAALAAVATILFWSSLASFLPSELLPMVLPFAAIGGGIGAVFLVYRLALTDGRVDIPTMLLAGVALNALAGSFIGVAIFASDDQQIRDINFWMLGSLAAARWDILLPVFCVIVPTLVYLQRQARALNAFLLGEQEAFYLGFDVERIKRKLLVLAAVVTGVIVAFSGIIGFVGLVVPHIVRLIIGPDHRWLLPASMLLGASLLVLADLMARLLVVPAELPLGVVTSALGAPFFIWLLSNSKGRGQL